MTDSPINSPLNLDLPSCRRRQARLLEAVADQRLDLLLLQLPEHVQWLVGPRMAWYFQPAVALAADGRATLAVPAKWKGDAAADEIVRYDAQWHSTLRNDQRAAATAALAAALSANMSGASPQLERDNAKRVGAKRIGVEFSGVTRHWPLPADVELVDVEPTLYRLRRRKDPDELAMLRRAIAATGVMYQRAREIIRPGIAELEVFSELQAAAIQTLGEPTTATGNDYQCGSRGGPPRAGRLAEAGELYILDLGPAYRGYFADNCRTIAVTEPDTRQLEAWRWLERALRLVEQTAKPGVSARELFHAVQQLLDQSPVGVFNHHLGHGIGLFPHEAPHLNPNWDDRFEPGDVFTAEPGLYAPDLRAGIRLENDYLITETGVERLSDFPLDLRL
jgi:Xaa-Pro dipeptidase